MNFLKTIAVVSAIAVSSFSVNAEQLSVAGITWDSEYDLGFSPFNDFIANASFVEARTATEISGSGRVGVLNGTAPTTFCVVAGCALTYTFDGFNIDTAGNVTGGTLDFWVEHADPLAADTLWLSLTSIFATQSSTATSSSFTSYFDVNEIAGTAWKNFDTNSQAHNADVSLISANNTFDIALNEYHGGGQFKSNSVPAPTTLAIFGLGLLGLAAARRKA
ncbi:PEP-CTERM sorting domain-containing protein [Colwellia echini]|uniref:PEP-CTERM sorting domain-containing protein n=1 Tax=Colwellia echini TaxID=1982103 RepID=A0ABY3MZ69_9GAMM|nr:PEP-CTERM sorting domain-containing protein [Colwellia echini]TYK66523.1 PEP-CTERM sorting domain-containing protein [Colwellia echini]